MKEKTKKYELLKDDFIEWFGIRLYRIKACRSFEDIAKGTLGGYIEKESNLSHDGNCWVYKGAKVWGNAKICDNAKIFAGSEVYDNAVVRDNACVDGAKIFENALVHGEAYAKDNVLIYGNAEIFGNALVRDDASVRGNAQIHGSAIIQNFAKVGDNAEVFGSAQICDFAEISGRARIYDRAIVGGDAVVGGNAEVYGKAQLRYGLLTQDIKKDLIQYIACSLNVYPVNGKYILYKRVNKVVPGVYASLFDPQFKYRDGEYAEAENPDPDFMKSCGGGIHVSTPFYWDEGSTLIAVEVDVNDVITCMEGKLRCKKVKVLGEVQTSKDM